jgi:hypothetical protein
VPCQSCCFKPAQIFLENLRKCLDELLCLHRTHGASMALANVIKHLKFRRGNCYKVLRGTTHCSHLRAPRGPMKWCLPTRGIISDRRPKRTRPRSHFVPRIAVRI